MEQIKVDSDFSAIKGFPDLSISEQKEPEMMEKSAFEDAKQSQEKFDYGSVAIFEQEIDSRIDYPVVDFNSNKQQI